MLNIFISNRYSALFCILIYYFILLFVGFGPIPTNDSSAPPTAAPSAVAAAAVASPAAQSQKSPRVPPQPQMRQQQQPQPTGGQQISEGEIRKRACKCFCTATSLCNECRHIKRRSTKRSLVANQCKFSFSIFPQHQPKIDLLFITIGKNIY